mgnify:CR=1 FL=1
MNEIVMDGIGAAYALGYIGPGGGLTAVGAIVALVLAVTLGLIGFVWYPLKRLLGRKRRAQGTGKMTPGE